MLSAMSPQSWALSLLRWHAVVQAWAGADEALEAPSAWQFSDSESDMDNELTDSEDDDDSPFDEIDGVRAETSPACLPGQKRLCQLCYVACMA